MPRQEPKHQQAQPKVIFPGPSTLDAIQIALGIHVGSSGGLDARLAEAVVQELRALPQSHSAEQSSLQLPSKKVAAGLLALYEVVLRWCLDDRGMGLQSSSTSSPGNMSSKPHKHRGSTSRAQCSSALLVRPSPVLCLLLRRHLAAYVTWLVGFSRPQLSAVASIPCRPTALAVAVATALLRCGTLQCYARLLSAAQKRIIGDRDIWRATDSVMLEAGALVLESSSLMRALAAVSEAVAGTSQRANAPSTIHHPPAAAANCPRSPVHPEAECTAPTAGACSPASSPSVPTPTAPETTPSSPSSPLPELLLTQMAESSVLSRLSRLLMLGVSKVNCGLPENMEGSCIQDDELHRLWVDVAAAMDSLGAILASLACCSSSRGQAAQGPYAAMLGLTSGSVLQCMLLSHTMSVCSTAGVTSGAGSGGLHDAAAPALKDANQDSKEGAVDTAALHNTMAASQLLVSRLPLWDEQGKIIVPYAQESQPSAAPTGARGKLADRLAARRQRQGQRGPSVSVSAAAAVAMHSAPDLAPAPRFVSLRLVHHGLLLLQAEVEEWRHRPPVTEDMDPRVGVELVRRSSSKPADGAAAGSSGRVAWPQTERVLQGSGIELWSVGLEGWEAFCVEAFEVHVGNWILEAEALVVGSLLRRLRCMYDTGKELVDGICAAVASELSGQAVDISFEVCERLRREYDKHCVLDASEMVEELRRQYGRTDAGVRSAEDILAEAEAAAQQTGSERSLSLTPAQRRLFQMPEGGWPALLRQWVGEMRARKDKLVMELRAQLEPEMQRLVLAAIERGLQQQGQEEEEASQSEGGCQQKEEEASPKGGCQQEGPQPESEPERPKLWTLPKDSYKLAIDGGAQPVYEKCRALVHPTLRSFAEHFHKVVPAVEPLTREIVPRAAAASRLPRFHLALHQYCLRIARMARAQWQVAAVAVTGGTKAPGRSSEVAAAGAPPSGAGAGARPPGSDVAAAPHVVFRNGPLSSVTLLALRIAKDDVLHRLEAVAGGGVPVAVADALQCRLAEWWSAACGVLSAAAAAVEAGQEWQRGNGGGGGGSGIAVEALCGLLALQATVKLTGPVGGAAGCATSGPHATHSNPTEQTDRTETHSENSGITTTKALTASSCQQAHATSGPDTSLQACPGSCSDSQRTQSPPAGRPGHDVAAALAAGVIPCVATLLRHLAAAPPPVHYRQEHKQGPPADLICPARALAALLQPLLGDDEARRQLLSYGDTGQVAALADSVAEMLRRLQGGAERWAAEQRRRGQQEGGEEAVGLEWMEKVLAGFTSACLLLDVTDGEAVSEGVPDTTASSGDIRQGTEDAGGCGAAATAAVPAISDSPELIRLRMALSCIRRRLTPAIRGAAGALAECVKLGASTLGKVLPADWAGILARAQGLAAA